MNRGELRTLIQGPIATLPTAFDEQFRVDFGVMATLTEWWVENGLVAGRAPIKVAAAMGEGPDLSEDEWPHLLRTVVNVAKDRAAVICALQTKDTLRTIEDAKRAQDLGAIGLQIDLPIFHRPTQDDYRRYFSDISQAIDIGIMIYNTWWFGAPSISAETMLRLADAEHVVAIKWATPPEGNVTYDDMRQFAHLFNVIDNDNQFVRGHRNGARGFIDATTAVYPQHALAIWDLLEARRYDEAQLRFDRINQPLIALTHRLAQRSGGYRVPKALMGLLGRPVGAPRPPTLPLDDQELAELRDLVAGFGWLG